MALMTVMRRRTPAEKKRRKKGVGKRGKKRMKMVMNKMVERRR